MKKRLLSILLAFSMVLTFLPLNAVTAFAEDSDIASGNCGIYKDNLTWKLSKDGTLTISGKGKMVDYFALDDESYGESVEDAFGNLWFDLKDDILRIVIEEGVTTIEEEVFSGCSNLTSVEIADSVESIGEGAFYGCTQLTSITIPDSVTWVDMNAFSGCSRLKSVKMSGSVKGIGSRVFANCTSLETFEIPDGVKTIDDGAFCGCSGLTSVKISDSVTYIDVDAFNGCSKLTSITIPNSVTAIGSGAFSGCSGLTDIQIPASVLSIGGNAFSNCSNLTSVQLSTSVTFIDDYAFYGSENVIIHYMGTRSQWNEVQRFDLDEYDEIPEESLLDKLVRFPSYVTFMNGDTEIETKTVPYDEMATAPDQSKITVPEGKYLTGWYTDKACTEKFDLQKNTIKEDLTLYAGFDYPTLTVTNGTFTYKNAANEEVTGKTGTVPVGTSVTVTFDKDFFADSHLKFSYWDIDGLEDPNAYQNKETFTFTMPGNAVTLEAMPQDDSIDDAVAEVLGTTAMVTTAVAGTAVLAYTGYQLGTEFYLICLLPSGAKIPANTAQLAELVWTDAGEPAPAAVLPEDATEDQQAMAWAVESDLIDADKAPDASVSRIEVIKTWKKAQSVKAG